MNLQKHHKNRHSETPYNILEESRLLFRIKMRTEQKLKGILNISAYEIVNENTKTKEW